MRACVALVTIAGVLALSVDAEAGRRRESSRIALPLTCVDGSVLVFSEDGGVYGEALDCTEQNPIDVPELTTDDLFVRVYVESGYSGEAHTAIGKVVGANNLVEHTHTLDTTGSLAPSAALYSSGTTRDFVVPSNLGDPVNVQIRSRLTLVGDPDQFGDQFMTLDSVTNPGNPLTLDPLTTNHLSLNAGEAYRLSQQLTSVVFDDAAITLRMRVWALRP